jgi:CRISPR/Cas system-associated protein Cas10 (large subunit of type III CRISPR-Cas system)
MQVGRIVYSPDYGKQSASTKPFEKRCGCCGTKGAVKFVKSFGDVLCPECRIEWRDSRKGF